MSCILRLVVPAPLAGAARAALRPYREGAPGAGRVTLHCVASDADLDAAARQARDAEAYLRAHAAVLAELRDAGGAGELDVAVALDAAAVQAGVRFPPTLVALAGELGLALVASVYAVGAEADGDAAPPAAAADPAR